MRSSVATASQERLQAIRNLNQKYEATHNTLIMSWMDYILNLFISNTLGEIYIGS